PFQTPQISVAGAFGALMAEEIEADRQPAVENLLYDLDRNFVGPKNSLQTAQASKKVKGLFVQHRSHAVAERGKPRMAEHFELIHAIPIDKCSKSKEIDPIFHRLVKGPQEPFLFVGATFQKFSRLSFPFIAEVAHQEIAHLPAMAHLLGIDSYNGAKILFRRGRIEQFALQFNRGKFRIALYSNES